MCCEGSLDTIATIRGWRSRIVSRRMSEKPMDDTTIETQDDIQYHATAFFIRAGEFLEAADEVFASENRNTAYKWLYPTFFLYAHAAELALKAFWRAHNLDIERDHHLVNLYEKSLDMGLIIGPRDQTQIGNVVRLLDSANRNQGLRYFLQPPVRLPDLAWTREVVRDLMQAVKPHVERAERENPSSSGKVVGLMVIFGKPVPQD